MGTGILASCAKNLNRILLYKEEATRAADSMQRPQPSVSIVCITYNHEKYIAQAIESFLAQEATFPVEILIGDDCSTDSTARIVKRYAVECSNIRFVENHRNRGPQRNLINLCNAASGKYIAFCEGDDYWIDSKKLQKQFELMEAHPEAKGCFHDTEIRVEPGLSWFLESDYSNTADNIMRWSTGHKKFEKKRSYVIEDYIPCGFIHTSSMFIRWDYNLEVPEWYYTHLVGDYPIWILQIGEGHFFFIDETMSVYRKNKGGVYNFTNRNDFWKKTKPDWITLDQEMMEYFEGRGARTSIIKAFEGRQKDDLIKMIKSWFATETSKCIKHRLDEYDALISERLGIRSHNVYSLGKKIGLTGKRAVKPYFSAVGIKKNPFSHARP